MLYCIETPCNLTTELVIVYPKGKTGAAIIDLQKMLPDWHRDSLAFMPVVIVFSMKNNLHVVVRLFKWEMQKVILAYKTNNL